MDEVNHVKMVVSLLYYYYVVHACFLLHDDAVIMPYKYFWVKRFLIFFYIADFLNGFSSEVSEVVYIWYQSEVETLRPIGLKTLHQVSF